MRMSKGYRNRMNSAAAKENLLKQVIGVSLNVFQHVFSIRLRIHSQFTRSERNLFSAAANSYARKAT